MRIEEIGRGVLFTFAEGDSPMEYPTAVYLIKGKRHTFLCDTHLGPLSMEPVKKYIDEHCSGKPLIIFNSHSDYDHVWGNCAFLGKTILAHALCYETMVKEGAAAMQAFAGLANGEVVLTPPTLTFEKRLAFIEDGVEFFYSPGHTLDSSSLYDHEAGVLFTGDILELPIPYIAHYKLENYLATLEAYKALNCDTVISSHSGQVKKQLIEDTFTYIKNIYTGREVKFLDEGANRIHSYNLKKIIASRYEKVARDEMGDAFDVKAFNSVVQTHINGAKEELEVALNGYIVNKR